jgi:L-amino acid N-acyltransferase YncA
MLAAPHLAKGAVGSARIAGVELRVAVADDAEAIRAIYNVFVETTTFTFDLRARTLAEQRAWLAARSGAHSALVAVDAGTVVGFGSLSPYRDRPAYATSVEDSVYVSPDRQGKGIGKLVLGGLLDTAAASGFHAVFARIVGGHEASIGLHASFGFELVGIEREVGRKFGRWLDVVVMQRLLR